MFPVDKIDKSSSNTAVIDTSDERKALDHFDGKTDDKTDDKGKDKARGKSEKSEDNEEETLETDDEIEETEEKIEDTENEDDVDDDDDVVAEDDNLYQQIKTRDEKLFKDIPELKHVIFREREYTELFPTVDDAKEAAEGYRVFQDFQNDITSGDSEKLIAALAETGKENLEGFVGNFLPTLEKQSKDLYLETLYPEFKKLFRAAARSTDENLKNAALHLHNFVFGDIELTREAGITPKKADPKADELTKREQEFEQRQVKSFSKDVETNAVGRAKRIIGKAFENSGISELLQKKLVDEIYSRVDNEVVKDARHMGNMNHLWRQAKAAGFTSDYKDRIVLAYLSRAKLLIPKMRQKVLSEAKLSVKVGEGNGENKPKRIPSSSAISSGNQQGKRLDIKKIDLSGENAERDLLDGKVVYKK